MAHLLANSADVKFLQSRGADRLRTEKRRAPRGQSALLCRVEAA